MADMGTQLRGMGVIRSLRCWAIGFVAVSALALLLGCNDTKDKKVKEPDSSNNSIPSIDSLTIPTVVPAGQTVEIKAEISGDAKSALTWSVTSETGEGTFDPAAGTVSFNAAGEAELKLSYAAPLVSGHFTHELVVTDEDADSADASMGINVRGVGVALFADPIWVNYNPASQYAEASNVEASLTSQGYAVLPFIGITDLDFQAATLGKAALVIPRLLIDLNASMTPTARSAIEQFVANGGLLIVNDDGSWARQLLTGIFGYGLTSAAPAGPFNLNSQIGPDSPFAGGPSPLAYNTMIRGVNTGSLPPNTVPVYSDVVGIVVFLTTHGGGQILYLGWDWYNAAPNGINDGGWLNVLNRGVNAAENGTF
jgi:hypothetical protein